MSERIKVGAVCGAAPRPFWSVMIPTYNCQKFLAETLRSVISQAPDASMMEIWVVDDGSPEGSPEELVREIAGDRVKFHRHPKNLGHVKNFEFCLNQARGEVVHMLHGDDYVLPGFYSAHEKAYKENPEIGAAFCCSRQIREAGEFVSNSPMVIGNTGVLPSDWVLELCVTNRLETPSITVKRSVYEKHDAFDSLYGWTEDWEMWGRIAASEPMYFIHDILAVYRRVEVSNTSKRYRTGENVTDFYNAGLKIQSYVADVPEAVTKEHQKHSAFCGIKVALLLFPQDIRGVYNNLKEAGKILPFFTLTRFFYSLVTGTQSKDKG
ncbi:MAG TPA: family 2 glycosyl transferase [Flavobacteriales bacterium]|nr:family 2 glycosyl transferase [Flavobacteriales bacterium]